MRHNSVVIDITHGLIHFPHLTIQVNSAASKASAKPHPVLTGDTVTITAMITKTIAASVNPSEWKTTSTVTPLEKFTETVSAANNATDPLRNSWAVCKCIRQTGLILTLENCHFGIKQVQFLGRTI